MGRVELASNPALCTCNYSGTDSEILAQIAPSGPQLFAVPASISPNKSEMYDFSRGERVGAPRIGRMGAKSLPVR